MVLRLSPVVAPRRGEHPSVKLRTVLQVIAYRQLRLRAAVSTERARQERREKTREQDFRLQPILLIVLVLITLQTRYRLKGGTCLQAEHLATMKYVAVLIGQSASSAEVTSSVCALRFERDRVWLVHAHLYVAVEQRRVRQFREAYVSISHRRQAREIVVRALQIRGTICPTPLYGGVVGKHTPAQRYVSSVTVLIGHVVYVIALMRHLVAVVVRPILMHAHEQGHAVGADIKRVCLKGDKLLVEFIKSLVV